MLHRVRAESLPRKDCFRHAEARRGGGADTRSAAIGTRRLTLRDLSGVGEKYVYYGCTGNRGKCDLPGCKEEELADRLGEPLRRLQIPPDAVEQIAATLREDQSRSANRMNAQRVRLKARLTSIQGRIDAAYKDKLDGKISENFWGRKN